MFGLYCFYSFLYSLFRVFFKLLFQLFPRNTCKIFEVLAPFDKIRRNFGKLRWKYYLIELYLSLLLVLVIANSKLKFKNNIKIYAIIYKFSAFCLLGVGFLVELNCYGQNQGLFISVPVLSYQQSVIFSNILKGFKDLEVLVPICSKSQHYLRTEIICETNLLKKKL